MDAGNLVLIQFALLAVQVVLITATPACIGRAFVCGIAVFQSSQAAMALIQYAIQEVAK